MAQDVPLLGATLQHRYRIERVLGEGATAVTYEATDLATERHVALKAFRQAAPRGALSEEFQALKGLFHPNLVEALDVVSSRSGSSLGVDAIITSLIVGADLNARAASMAWPQFRVHLLDALHGLGFLHSCGLLHGDIKGENILVGDEGQTKLIDLGCCRPLGPLGDRLSGTPAYWPPEMSSATQVDARHDLFALGITATRLIDKYFEAVPPKDRQALERLCSTDVARRPLSASVALEQLGDERPLLLAPAGRSHRLLERDIQVNDFDQRLNALVSHQAGGQLLCYFGGHGIGKTRLLTELRWKAQLRAPVVDGFASRRFGVSEWLSRAFGREMVTVSQLCEALESRSTEVPLCLFFDDFDRLERSERQLFDALVRSLRPEHRVLLATTCTDTVGELPGAVRQELRPLSEAAVHLWSESAGDAHRSKSVYEATSGFPGEVEARLSAQAHMPRRNAVQQDLDHHTEATTPLSREQLPVMAFIIARGGSIDTSAAEGIPDGYFHLQRLAQAGLVCATADGFKLLHRGQLESLKRQVPRALLQAEHARIASSLAPDVHRDHERAYHLAAAGNRSLAEDLLVQSATGPAWESAAEVLKTAPSGPHVALRCAEVFLECSRFSDAMSLCASHLRRADPEMRAALRRVAIDATLRRGDPRLALKRAQSVLVSASAEERPALFALMGRSAVQLGRYAEAEKFLKHCLALEPEASVRASAKESLGAALVYLGKSTDARNVLESARSDYVARGEARAHSRTLSLLAISHSRTAEHDAARAYYQKALELAEVHDFTELAASASLNLATLAEQRGLWGEALEGYESARRLARAIGKANTELRVQFNLGNLLLRVGALTDARSLLEKSLEGARTTSDLAVEASAHLSLAELYQHTGDELQSREHGDCAFQLFSRAGTPDALSEVWLQRAALALSTNETLRAADALAQAGEAERLMDSPDLACARMRLGALLARQTGSSTDALDLARRAEELAQGLQLTEQAAFAAEVRAGALIADNQVAEARKCTARARLAWDRLALSLPLAYREIFWSHPARRRPESTERSLAESNHSALLFKLLSINRRLNSTLDVDRVLSAALDAAIELTGAERGFVLTRQDEGDLLLRCARNLEAGQLDEGHLSFSRSIAERVLNEEEPVVTLDARRDPRFKSEVSVHAMHLKSVACVPFASALGLKGVLYVDNRLQHAQFDLRHSGLLLAFANQVALALGNAHLYSQLEETTAQLRKANRAAQRTLREQRLDLEQLQTTVQRQQQQLGRQYDYAQLSGRGPAMQQVFSVLDRVIDADVTLLISGESGTGKELVAKTVHQHSHRKEGPFVGINCGALPENLLESELFGHRRGSFSGATEDKLGLMVAANGGSLFLDEIGEMPLSLQVKLLRVLQEREVRPLGATENTRLDVRLICATNRELEEEVRKGRFREDLFYRLNVVTVQLPPLRDRLEDLAELCFRLLERIAERLSRPVPSLSTDGLNKLGTYTWPGNVRELENVLTRACVMSKETIGADEISLPKPKKRSRASDRQQYERDEAQVILEALRGHRWNVSRVAKLLNIPRNTLYRKMDKYRILRNAEPPV